LIGDLTTGRFAALYEDSAGVLTGAVTVSWPKAMLAARRMLAAGGTAAAADARAAIEELSAMHVRSTAG
jgi:hypothetical protein